MVKLIGIVGTNSKKSTNRDLLKFIQRHVSAVAEVELAEISDFEMFNKPQDMTPPENVLELAKKIEAADGVIISTPEYDHACPAVLMNALAWLSYGVKPLFDKPVMITGASYGTLGSSRAQAHLRQILDSPEIKARVMPSSEFLLGHSLQAFDEKGNLKDTEKIALFDGLFNDFLSFIEISKQLSHAVKAKREEVENVNWEEQ